MLFFFRDGNLVSSYPVGLGRPTWPTPPGNFAILEKEIDPAWDVPVSIQQEMREEGKPVRTRVPPGPDNPLGKYFLRISPFLGIHGTIAPLSVYRFQTHGCIRLHPNDVADLFARVSVGTPVRILYAPVLLAQSDDGMIYLEVHRDIYRRAPDALTFIQEATASAGLTPSVDWTMVEELLSRRQGALVNVTRFNAPALSEKAPPISMDSPGGPSKTAVSSATLPPAATTSPSPAGAGCGSP
jgi:L,D-transpeptidase ErfK/SrfK